MQGAYELVREEKGTCHSKLDVTKQFISSTILVSGRTQAEGGLGNQTCTSFKDFRELNFCTCVHMCAFFGSMTGTKTGTELANDVAARDHVKFKTHHRPLRMPTKTSPLQKGQQCLSVRSGSCENFQPRGTRMEEFKSFFHC